jgi:hypothetical protein
MGFRAGFLNFEGFTMSFWADIEAEFNAVIASADAIPTKLEALVGIQSKAATMTALTNQLTAIVDDGTKNTPDKVTEILTACGKL